MRVPIYHNQPTASPEIVQCLWEKGLLRWHYCKEPACQCRRQKRCGFNPWVGKIPWRRKWQPTPGFLPGEFHGQRSLTGYSPWGCKESDTAERLGSAHDSTRNKPRLAAGAGVSTFKCTGWTGLGRERNEIRFNSR